jgi:hypothetical protein
MDKLQTDKSSQVQSQNTPMNSHTELCTHTTQPQEEAASVMVFL